MKVLLVSDAEAVLAGVAIEVGMGSYSDPDYMPGLAHFIEHTLVMGSKHYPGTNDFYDLLAENGGASNAFTTGEVTDTNYQVNTDALNATLKILADMYQYPLFPYTTCQLESFAIESEYQLSYNTLFYRVYGVLLDLYDDDSPANKFSVGNYQTLIENVTASGRNFSTELSKQHKKYYSPQLMTMTVISNDSLEAMEETVREYFSSIPVNEDLPNNLYQNLSMPLNKNLGTYAQVLAGEEDGDTVFVFFQLPPARENLDVNPIQYLSYLFDDDGPGSLNAYMRSTGMAYYASATLLENTSFFTIVAFEVGVTYMGLYRVDFIVRVILEYIDFLKEKAINEDVYNAYAQAKRNSFDYGDFESQYPMDKASTLSQHISEFGLNHAFTESTLLNQYDEKVLRKVFDQINTENMVIILASDAFVVDSSILDEITEDPRTIGDPLKAANVTLEEEEESSEAPATASQFLEKKSSKRKTKRRLLDPPDFIASLTTHSLAFAKLDKFLVLYNATYTYQPIPESFYDSLTDSASIDLDNAVYGTPEFTLPNIEDFLASDLRLICNDTDLSVCKSQYKADALNSIESVTLNDGSTMWYQLDRSYLVPRLVVSLILHSPDAVDSIENYAQFMIFCAMIQDIPGIYLSDFAAGDFQTTFGCSRGHAYMFVEGFSDKMDEAIGILAQALEAFGQVAEDSFSSYQMSAAYSASGENIDPEYRVRDLRDQILTQNYYGGTELANAIDDVTQSQWMKKYGGTKKFFYEGLVIGNVLQEAATEYLESLITAFDLELSDKSDIPEDLSRLLNGTYAVYREWNKNSDSNDNEIYNYYQTGPRTHKTEAFLLMLKNQFRNEAFDELRNMRQLGYVANGDFFPSKDVIGFFVEIEGPVKNPQDLDEEIENFIHAFYHYLQNLSDESFQNIKEAFLSMLTVPPITLYDKASIYLTHLLQMTYDFDHSSKLAKVAENFTKEDTIQFYNDTMHDHPNKISLQIWKYEEGATLSSKGLRANETFSHKKETVFDDIDELIASL